MNEVDLLRQEVAQLRAEIDRVNEWSTGLFCVLHDVLPPLLREKPALAAALAPKWHLAAEQFDLASENTGQADSFEETADRLEARKMLYRLFAQLKLWPDPA